MATDTSCILSPTDTDAPIRVLIVDDDPDCRMLLRDAVEHSGVTHEIIEAGNGEEALRILRQEHAGGDGAMPGLIFLDVEMPGIDGIEALRRIRQELELRDVPVVMLTGVSDRQSIEQAARLGANSYTLKPVDAARFLQTIQESTGYWLRIHQYPTHHHRQEDCRR
ncbi:MAG: response regulator [Phycisphaerae bacterium]